MVTSYFLEKLACKPIYIGTSLLTCLLLNSGISFAEVTIPKDWPRMAPGYFEATVNMFGQQHTNHVCLTKADLQDAEKEMAAENDCNILKTMQKGNQYIVEMDCRSPENGKPMHMLMTSTLLSETHSTTDMQGTQAGQLVFKMHTTLKRKRDCSAEEKLQSKTIGNGNVVDQIGDSLDKGSLEALKGLMKDLAL